MGLFNKNKMIVLAMMMSTTFVLGACSDSSSSESSESEDSNSVKETETTETVEESKPSFAVDDSQKMELDMNDAGITAYVSEETYIANTSDNFRKINSYKLKDQMHKIDEMVTNKELIVLPVDTEVEVIEKDSLTSSFKVRVPEYDLEGYIGVRYLYKL